MNILTIEKSRNQQSAYDWSNIEYGSSRIGKLRTRQQEEELVIYSIQIFPEYQGHGFGTKIVEYLKHSYATLVADHVRPSAKGFWDKMGFIPVSTDQFMYTRDTASNAQP
jgi:ribosomal protein S18 acetylase RimI-like enzyme